MFLVTSTQPTCDFYSPLDAANNVGWPQDECKRYAVAHEDAGQEHVAQFSAGCADHGCVVVPEMTTTNVQSLFLVTVCCVPSRRIIMRFVAPPQPVTKTSAGGGFSKQWARKVNFGDETRERGGLGKWNNINGAQGVNFDAIS